MRDLIRNITAGFYTRKLLRIGTRVEISGHKGVLLEINATHAILQAEDREIAIANTAFLETAAESLPGEE
jgi:hypothetical protein